MLSLTWFNAKNKSNELAHLILVLIDCDTKTKAQSSLCKCVDWAGPSLLLYTQNRCRLSLRPEFSPTVSGLAHIWYKYQTVMCCSKPSVEHLYFMIKKSSFFILWQRNWNFCYCQIINMWWDIQYLVYYIIHNTYKTNDRRRTTISISDIYNDILHNVKEMNSFGGHLANYICIVLVTMLTHFHSIFLNI